MKTIYFTTFFLLVFTLLSQLESSSWTLINVMFIIGNLFVIFMVYKVLKELYFTTKNFENWYEDKPRSIQK